MKGIKSLILLFAGLLFSFQAFTQLPSFNGTDPLTNEAEFSMTVSKTKDICVGDVITLCFKGQILVDGWHLYSARDDAEGSELSYNPTLLDIFMDESKGLKKKGKMTEDKKPDEREDELMGGIIRDFHEKEVNFCQKVTITSKDVNVVGELSAQVCTEAGMCKFLKLPFEWIFTACEKEKPPVENGGDKNGNDGNNGNNGTNGNPDENGGPNAGGDPVDTVPAADTSSASVVDTAATDSAAAGLGSGTDGNAGGADGDEVGPADEKEKKGGLFGDFFLAFLFGLGAILTPCVFPMIPLTVSFFTKSGEGETKASARAKGIRNGIAYGTSIVLIYGGLGLLITLIFGPTALYNMSSHWIANILFFAIFLVFAFSFLGAFEITLPSSWSSKINSRAGQGGLLGVFFMALTLVLVSFSCTGPLLGTALVSSVQGDATIWSPVAAMVGFGMAFAIPFGLFAVFPSWLQGLPQAGGWMNTVKVFFGFLELALCMKFLSNADLSMHWHLLDRQVFLGLWIVIFALMGAYFLGWIRLPHDDEHKHTSVPKLMFAIASFGFTMYLVPGLWGAPLSMLEGLIPPQHKNVGVKLLPHQVPEYTYGAGGEMPLNDQICKSDRKYAFLFEDREAHGFCMFYDLEQAKEFAKEKNKPLFVDFTGHTCANCRKMENDVWVVDRVRDMLREDYVMVSLYADEPHKFEKPIINPDGVKLRRIRDWVQDYQSRKFGTIAQPYYVLMDHDESELVKSRGYTPNVAEFHGFLKKGVANFNKRHGIKDEKAAKGGSDTHAAGH